MNVPRVLIATGAAGCVLCAAIAEDTNVLTVTKLKDQSGETKMSWIIDNTNSICGHPVTVEGAPKVVETEKGKAVVFNGASDGLVVTANPIEGLKAFTIEALFRPDGDGAQEQRFFHVNEDAGERRVLLETRVPRKGEWYADTYIHQGKKGTALADAGKSHSTDAWHTLALVFDGKRMLQYVDGVQELSGSVVYGGMGKGKTSIGMRINKVHWFKGAIREIRITPRALPASELLKP
jgi:hypothetical protein